MSIYAAVIRGPFSADHFAKLADLLRDITATSEPGSDFELVAVDPDQTSLDHAEAALREIMQQRRPGEQITYGRRPNDLSDAALLARAVLLYHRGGPWTAEDAGTWLGLTGSPEATTRALCDLARRVRAAERSE